TPRLIFGGLCGRKFRVNSAHKCKLWGWKDRHLKRSARPDQGNAPAGLSRDTNPQRQGTALLSGSADVSFCAGRAKQAPQTPSRTDSNSIGLAGQRGRYTPIAPSPISFQSISEWVIHEDTCSC